MKKARMSKSTDIFNILRLTTSFNDTAKLKANILPQRALKKLSEYEKTGLTPFEILQMKETISNLQKRLKQLEDW